MRNSGRTPSTDVQGLFLVYISPLDNPPALLADQCASCVRSVVLPNGVVSYKLSVRDNVMTADEVQRIKDGKDTMWIVGRLDYHDGEGEAHTTRILPLLPHRRHRLLHGLQRRKFGELTRQS